MLCLFDYLFFCLQANSIYVEFFVLQWTLHFFKFMNSVMFQHRTKFILTLTGNNINSGI